MAVTTIPPPGEKPLLVRSWWEGLGNGERLGLVAAHPELIGGLDGIPVEVRDRANRADLDAIITAADATDTGAVDPALSQASERILRIIDDRAAMFDLRTLHDWITRPSPVVGLAYHLIGLDTGGNGRTVVSLGNPDASENIAVFVPGAVSVADEARVDYARMDAMAIDAARRDGTRPTAVVRWLGHKTADVRFAEEAAPDLYRFVAGLRVTRYGPPARITMIGHSYGATVIGVTDRDHRLAADALVFIAAPGVGVDRADDLSVGAARVWATVAPGDLIDATPPDLLGVSPTSPGFGAARFACADTGRPPWWLAVVGVPRDPAKAHNGYWKPGNVARDNVAAIVTGDTTAVRLEHT